MTCSGGHIDIYGYVYNVLDYTVLDQHWFYPDGFYALAPTVATLRPRGPRPSTGRGALVVLNADILDEKLARDTLNLVLKYEGDVEGAEDKLAEIFARANKTVGSP